MTSTLKTSPAGRRLIKGFEGFRRKAAPLPGGGWVIGYGHTKSARAGLAIGEEDAGLLLIYDLIPVEAALNAHIDAPLTQNQFDALASLTLNIGVENFLNSTILTQLNRGRPMEAAQGFDQWRCVMLDGDRVAAEPLMRRRAAERALFLTPPGGPAPAPTPELAVIADDAPAGLSLPVVAYRPDLTGESALGEFALVQAPEPAPEAEPEPELKIEFEPEAEPEDAVAPQLESDEVDFIPADEAAPVAFAAEPVSETGEAEPEAEPEAEALDIQDAELDEHGDESRTEEAEEAALPSAEAALDEDEPVEEVYVAGAEPGLRDEAEPAADDAAAEPDDAPEAAEDELEAAPEPEDEPEPEPEPEPAAREESWIERARERARLGGQAVPLGLPPEARPEDLLLRNTDAEWAVEEDAEYSPQGDRGALWYVVFLLIGVSLAGFGAWDTWQRVARPIDEAFLYGPVLAGAGALFMAIAGWFLIKRVLEFR